MNQIKNNKRAASHIEVILSFVIFLGFLIFLLAVFNPFTNSSRGNALDAVERAIRNSTENEIEFVTLRLLEVEKTEKCFYLPFILKENIYVKNESMDYIKSLNQNGKIYLENQGTFFYVYSSEDFAQGELDSGECKLLENKPTKPEYALGLYRNSPIISFKKLGLLTQEYNSNYLQLKSRLGIKSEFAFNVRDTSSNSIISVNKKGTNVYARDVPIQLVYSNGTLKYAVLNIQTWS